jgi:3-oxoacyl-[acyl-carrier protein] reductase
MASLEQIVALFPEVQKAHNAPVDILIPNAGYGKRITDIEDIPLEECEHTINVNLRAIFLLVQGVVKNMKAQKWGRTIFTSSIAAYGTSINGAHYAASKGGLLSLTKRLAVWGRLIFRLMMLRLRWWWDGVDSG